ncbi:hypothetical protein K2Z83_11285 [Oscillochloris sp. ZM17-4]|uniref:hypothetical protein n=1 Tax=Oscillochloris sp. ZM17-4 TaxID=2866714 RepID=UPI001C72CFE0|nr:hypothetical protein [Oscillochloris sp. ZM17-4]MBX0328259.1 hypothetical protein [Oscillochloris sp. ZM17-4]
MPSGQYFLDVDTTTGEIVRQTAIQQSTGATDADKILRTGPDGKLDSSFLPSTSDSSETIQASEALSAGDWVNIYNVSGSRRVQKALATDNTKPAHGYVSAAVNSGANASVFTRGINPVVPLSGFTTADVGKPVFLSAGTSGGVTKTPPGAAGNIVQRLGFVVEVGATVRVQIDMSYIVKL